MEIEKLKQQDGPMLQVHGSSNLIQTLLANDLTDELWLKVFPVTLGKGKRLFAEGTIPAAFKLTESKISPEGVILASYKRDGEVKIIWSAVRPNYAKGKKARLQCLIVF